MPQLTSESLIRLNTVLNKNHKEKPIIEITAIGMVSSINATFQTGILDICNLCLDFTFQVNDHLDESSFTINLKTGKFTPEINNRKSN